MKKIKSKGIYQLFILMILVALILTIISIVIMYKITFNEKKILLQELCENQQDIIQSIYKETDDLDAVLNVLYKQQKITNGLGTTGEFAIGYSKNDSIFFLLKMRQNDTSNYEPVPLKTDIAVPMQYALSNNSGFIQGLDYRGNEVLAYCTYIPELNWGLVTKMDISEVRVPFYRAGLYAIISSMFLLIISIILFRKFSRPITKKLDEGEENYRRLFEYSAIPIWREDYSEIKKYIDNLRFSGISDFRTYFEEHMSDVNHLASLIKVVEINQKSVEFFKAENKEEVIKNMLFYLNETSLNVFREELIVLAEGGRRFECEMPIRTLTGDVKTLYLNLSVVTGFENTLANVLVSFIDISERKRFENELENKNAELQGTNASKDKFFKIIAHDMKNPFISLLGASELLYENADKYDSDKIVKLTKILNDSAKNGYDMLINLLEWAKSQAGSMLFQPEKIKLKELIDKGLSNSVEYASNKKINLTFEIASNLEVYADKNMLETILRNLINNALKFTPKGGTVSVGTKNEEDSIIIFVRDTGTGIERSDLDKLFRIDIKYSQPGTDREGGTGLGLLLCKEFIEKHNGKIWIESEVGKGSIFYFSLKNVEN
jgi:signal transduction histidine kinase